ncbi:ABC transporter ATP-binding protein [Microbacterium betulae]|uniref:ABC transporter ATP-binding protein n=1 Tax=Microbacterium betulae TaxID=2981139 RepID=A0AA97FI59_9MICO|nr:ABC transporter ATP-binding protein [Microbacterium sp. AB]WOF23485.1 ABC transporter ATP-binding protein [Microbacterium sp. AB]
MSAETASVLEVSGLSIARRRGAGIVEGVDLSVRRGECVGLVGESGSGKSLTLRAIMALLPDGVEATGGEVRVDGLPMPRSGAAARSSRRGRLSMVFQDPAAALDPLRRVGAQVAAVRRHVRGRSARAAREDALGLLADVRLPDPAAAYERYPHELSGGQRQRVMIAVALASEPEFLLCDEPTTALDVTVQAEILALLDDIRRSRSVGVLFVSHDLPVVSTVSSRLVVMRRGVVVEAGDTIDVLGAPRDPYTRGLVRAAAELSADSPAGGSGS